MKNILITGANGQVGQEFQAIATLYPKFHFLFANKQSLNITNADAVNTYFEANAIDAVVNCAAYTKVDKAESEVALANLVNGIGALNLAKACAAHNAWMIQISTDFVFNGQSKKPYQTNHPTQPIGVYGSSKLLGEQAILEHCPKGVVLRTSWVYSTFGHNFVKTMLRLGTSRSELGVIADQTG
ncbi:MAG: SDR family oxidoreductase, partial [Chitinophagales bacterium]